VCGIDERDSAHLYRFMCVHGKWFVSCYV